MQISASVPADIAEPMHDRALDDVKPVEPVFEMLLDDYTTPGFMGKEEVSLDDYLVEMMGDELSSEGELMTICRLSLTDSAEAGERLKRLMLTQIRNYAEQHGDRLAEKYKAA